jgi:hypothetical protein
MSSLLLRQFIEGRKKYLPIEYTRLLGLKRNAVLDRIIPNISDNLTNSSIAFLDAVMDLDDNFVK